jgi:vitamin B12 transporter
VHEFFRSWESVGQRDLKEVIPSQLLHSAVLLYEVRGEAVSLSNSFEVQNLTDAKAYDYFGVQRPGRAFYFKITALR